MSEVITLAAIPDWQSWFLKDDDKPEPKPDPVKARANSGLLHPNSPGSFRNFGFFTARLVKAGGFFESTDADGRPFIVNPGEAVIDTHLTPGMRRRDFTRENVAESISSIMGNFIDTDTDRLPRILGVTHRPIADRISEWTEDLRIVEVDETILPPRLVVAIRSAHDQASPGHPMGNLVVAEYAPQ